MEMNHQKRGREGGGEEEDGDQQKKSSNDRKKDRRDKARGRGEICEHMFVCKDKYVL